MAGRPAHGKRGPKAGSPVSAASDSCLARRAGVGSGGVATAGTPLPPTGWSVLV